MKEGEVLDVVLASQRLEGLRAAIFSRGMRRLQHLGLFFGLAELRYRPAGSRANEVDVVLTWGRKGTGRMAEAYARRHGKPLVRVEDGFFRSVRPGQAEAPLSLVADQQGIYYDASAPSDLEAMLLADARLEESEWLSRARELLETVRRERISKYNHAPFRCELPPSTRTRVLLVDQTAGDASLRFGLTPQDAPHRMLAWARQQYPRAELVIRTHPDVVAGSKRSFLLSELSAEELRGVRIDAKPTNPHRLLERVDHVVTATSQLGFEALIHGKHVTCFGVPFYAGWGLTEDQLPVSRRGRVRSLEQLALASLLLYPRYVHPTYQRRCEAEEILALLALQVRQHERVRGSTVAVGFSGWKQPSVERFFGVPGRPLRFVRSLETPERLASAGVDRVLVWGQRLSIEQERAIRDKNVAVARVEDGFLRSNQLGSDLTAPASLVCDESGIYYDPSRPSDLETLLQAGDCTVEEQARAARLRESLVRLSLTKYNVQSAKPPAVRAASKQVLLLVGQVDGDASVRLGGGGIETNGQLVRAVRAAHPGAFLLFKAHPDVVAGNRPGKLTQEERGLLDHLEEDASSLACLAVAHEVHTLTSLLGFEALLRGVPVCTYGLPFYAGWGLTRDRMNCARRTRMLSLDELTYQVLIRYPLYLNRQTGYHAEVEEIVFELATHREKAGAPGVRASVGRQLGRALRYLRGGLRAF